MKQKWNISPKTLIFPLFFILIFYGVAFWRFFATGKVFYIYNFCYIGTSIALGIFLTDALPRKHVAWGRRISQILIGSYMLIYLGFIGRENMQLEGFFFYLFGGIFAGATLHYFLAKIAGVALFNRGWCSWACWTAMVLDVLPWRKSPGRKKGWGAVRYIHFILSFGLTFYVWFILKQRSIYESSMAELYWLAMGNALYYIVAIALAFVLKDNRAFCKYICPIPAMQKVMSRFSLLKVDIDGEKCTECGICEKNCPMDIKLLSYKGKNQRIKSTECVLCLTCSHVCPADAVKFNAKLDCSVKEELRYQEKKNEG